METYVITEHGCFSLKFPIMKLKSDEERVFDETLAQIIKARRDKLNLSQQYISDNASVSRTTLVKWEKGEKTPVQESFRILERFFCYIRKERAPHP